MEEVKNSPIEGYRDLTSETVAKVNENKVIEESVLRKIDDLANSGQVDYRWLAIGKEHIEQGFMAINRSIMQPKRLKGDL